jgi:hypothetical protein
MTFFKAIPYWNPTSTWDPESINGQVIIWGWGTMWADQTWTFDLVVQIDKDVPPATELLNVIDAWGDSSNDIDINSANNHFEYMLYTLVNRLLLPFAMRMP